MNISNIGIKIKKMALIIGNILYSCPLIWRSYLKPRIDTIPSMEPSKYEPPSPIKIFAGKKLYLRKPIDDPIIAEHKKINSKFGEGKDKNIIIIPI